MDEDLGTVAIGTAMNIHWDGEIGWPELMPTRIFAPLANYSQ